jgi:hypothetical protein
MHMSTSSDQQGSREPFVEQRLRLLLESLSDYAVFLVDADGVIQTWNPGVAQVLGYDADEFIGLPFASLFTPEDIHNNAPDEELARARSSGRSDDRRIHLRRDGTRFHADGVITALRDEQGNLRAFSKVMHDVTAQVRASAALQDSEERYRLLVESIRDYAIFLLDASGHVASWTAAAERMKGYAPAEIIGQHLSVFFTREDRQRGQPEQELRGAAATGRYEGEGWRVRKDGSRFWGDEILTAIRDGSGELRGFAKIVRDLTERQRASLERELLYQQARDANRLKDEFLGTVSHELRTPLNALLGWTHLLRVGTQEEERRRAIDAIRRNAEIQVQLVDDLLDVSRIISGKMRLQIAPTELTPVLEASAESLQPAARAKGVSLQVECPASADTVAADPGRLQQMVWNLLSNAVKFTPAGGRVRLCARRIGNAAEIEVTDTGAGISPDVLPFVFERFRQGDSSSTRTHGGMGLGLALVRHLAELHGGTIEAESGGPGLGATFRLHLPLVASSVTAAEPPARQQVPPLTNVHVLVVEDDADSREVLSIVLQESGAIVAAAESAEQALALFSERRPDVIIADIGMPGGDGYEFIRRVRRMDPEQGGSAAAIALTAYARPDDRRRALEAGYQLHVPKPVDPVAVVRAVAQVIPH